MNTREANGRPPRISTVRVAARGEDFRIVQLAGNLFVCTKQTGSCCCGWEEKGRMPFETSLWSDEWERRRIRNQIHLTLVSCRDGVGEARRGRESGGRGA